MTELLEKISLELAVPSEMLSAALSRSRKEVRCIRIPKRDGNYRKAYQPSKKLKIIQYWLLKVVFSQLKVHPCSVGYQKGKSIKTNAVLHSKNRYFLKMDFKDFFPSIIFEDIKPIIARWCHESKFTSNEDDLLELIRLSCFYNGDVLPIGYPTSPIISNIVMNEFDLLVSSELAGKEDVFGKVVYTRYADDMVFSTNKSGVCYAIKECVLEILSSIDSPKLSLNCGKTKITSSSGGSALVTGLRICHDEHVTVHRKYKDKVRLMLSLFGKGALDASEFSILRGHLSYLMNVDSIFYTKLQKKYFAIISKLFEI